MKQFVILNTISEKKKKKVTNIKQVGVLKDVRAQKLPRTDFFKTLTAGRK